jgi:hypothetical protein
MQSGVYAADALADIVEGASEAEAWRRYEWQCRRRFTFSFLMGWVVRGAVTTPILDGLAAVFNNPMVQRAITRTVGSALAGSSVAASASPTVAAEPAKCPIPHAAAN